MWKWVLARFGKPVRSTCRYCNKTATHNIVWVRGAFGKPGPVRVPYCGECSIKDALAERGMTARVLEGEDYQIEARQAG